MTNQSNNLTSESNSLTDKSNCLDRTSATSIAERAAIELGEALAVATQGIHLRSLPEDCEDVFVWHVDNAGNLFV